MSLPDKFLVPNGMCSSKDDSKPCYVANRPMPAAMVAANIVDMEGFDYGLTHLTF